MPDVPFLQTHFEIDFVVIHRALFMHGFFGEHDFGRFTENKKQIMHHEIH